MKITRISYKGFEKLVVQVKLGKESALLTFVERDSIWLTSALVSDREDSEIRYYERSYFITPSGKVDPRAFSHRIVRRINDVIVHKLGKVDHLALSPDVRK